MCCWCCWRTRKKYRRRKQSDVKEPINPAKPITPRDIVGEKFKLFCDNFYGVGWDGYNSRGKYTWI